MRKKELMKHFKSVKRISEATVEEIASVKGIDKTTAENIALYFSQEKNNDITGQ